MTPSWWRGRGPVAMVVGAALATFTAHALLRFLTYHSPAYDLGFFDQLTNNLSAGRGWASSFLGYDFRGQHWEPVLLVWAQLYRLVASPIWLLVINSIALALTPLAAWRLARCWLGAASAVPLIAAVAAALSPLLLRTAAFDYHSEALTPLLALLALEAASRRRWLATAACCAALLLLKEDAFLVVAGIGWLIWRADRRRAGLLISAAALAGFVAVVGVYTPSIRHGHSSDLLARYAYLATGGHPTGPFEVLAGMVTHPLTWMAHLVTAAPLNGLAVAFLPLALLPLLSGWAVVGAILPLTVALLSSDPLQSSLHLHYGAESFPLLLACALLGWRRVASWRRFRPAQVRRALVAAAVVVMVAAVPLAVSLSMWAADLRGLDRRERVEAVLGRIPRDAAVAASTDLVAHLSERAAIFEFPDVRGSRWVVIDSDSPPSLPSRMAGYRSALAELPRAFRVVASGGGVALWERT